MLLLGAFLAPLAFLVPVSFRPYVPGRGIGEGFTGEHSSVLHDLYYLEIFGRTILLGAIVTTMTLLVGYPLAYFLAEQIPVAFLAYNPRRFPAASQSGRANLRLDCPPR